MSKILSFSFITRRLSALSLAVRCNFLSLVSMQRSLSRLEDLSESSSIESVKELCTRSCQALNSSLRFVRVYSSPSKKEIWWERSNCMIFWFWCTEAPRRLSRLQELDLSTKRNQKKTCQPKEVISTNALLPEAAAASPPEGGEITIVHPRTVNLVAPLILKAVNLKSTSDLLISITL